MFSPLVCSPRVACHCQCASPAGGSTAYESFLGLAKHTRGCAMAKLTGDCLRCPNRHDCHELMCVAYLISSEVLWYHHHHHHHQRHRHLSVVLEALLPLLHVIICSGSDSDGSTRACRSDKKYSTCVSQVLIQEYLHGTEFVVDTVSREGRHKVMQNSRDVVMHCVVGWCACS